MLRNIWHSSNLAAQNLGIAEINLSSLREHGLLKPGVHWKSSPHGQKKPWNPEVLYNTIMCEKIIDKFVSKEQHDKYVA